jgi:hypothetical protein
MIQIKNLQMARALLRPMKDARHRTGVRPARSA